MTIQENPDPKRKSDIFVVFLWSTFLLIAVGMVSAWGVHYRDMRERVGKRTEVLAPIIPSKSTPPGAEVQNVETQPALSDWGLFGDSFGSLNTLFSGLAMLGIALSLILQHLEQKGAAKEHKEKMKLEKAAYVAQKNAANAQIKNATESTRIQRLNCRLQAVAAMVATFENRLHLVANRTEGVSNFDNLQAPPDHMQRHLMNRINEMMVEMRNLEAEILCPPATATTSDVRPPVDDESA